ncbi:hypothetical protein ABZ383_19930 [Streptomyces sp. NPDC005900]|uniref:hypothetical protein n=1 Tax=Streptomyces sp. NPDC005900 TaxID=3154569 RepID=UPI0033C60C8A
MGVDSDDIGLEPPIDCRAKPRPPCCAVDEYRIALGRITLDDAKRMTARVTVLLDELAGYRAGPGNP